MEKLKRVLSNYMGQGRMVKINGVETEEEVNATRIRWDNPVRQ